MSARRSGPTSFGYQRRDGKLVVHPEEAPIRRRVFELFVEHQRMRTVADILNADGARTRNGAMFTGHTVGRLLQEDTVTGAPGVAEPLVSKELFERCKGILAAQRRSGGARRKVVHLFAGFVHCACGGKMYVPSNSKKYVCKTCRAKMPVDDLEAVFCSQLANYEPPNGLKSSFSKLTHRWPTLSFETRREIVECVTECIEIDAKKVTCCLVAL